MEIPRTMKTEAVKRHPCFSREAHHRYGRIHLPVAPACNIQCKYCVKRYDCANESRPGVTSRVLPPREAVERVRAVVGRDERITVIGVAGPGDPLANDATFEFMRLVKGEFPHLEICLSTNGLLLPDRLEELLDAGLGTLTVTINAVSAETAAGIYSWASYGNTRYSGLDAAGLLLQNQWTGLRQAVAAGLTVKVNTVYVPGVNGEEIPLVARAAGALGAYIQNITALIPQGELAGLKRPGREEIAFLRLTCGEHITQMTHCRQCRADATGLMGENRDMEMEALLAKIGDEYADSVVC